ncbi:MAG: glycosyltransferase [Candidatus Absconditabacteria bacterium]
MVKSVSLSIVIPCYNEQNRLSYTIDQLIEAANKLRIIYQIVLVNDGSQDQTYKEMKRLASLYSQITIISYSVNQGKGYAVKMGIQSSQSEYYLIMDADLATDISELQPFWNVRKEADCIIGNRTAQDNKITFLRSLSGRIAHKIITKTFNLTVEDTQCGFKLFSEKTQHLWADMFAKRWGFDFEFLYLLQKHHYTIKELPVRWVAMSGSKVTLLSYPLTLIELYRIVRYHHIHLFPTIFDSLKKNLGKK